MRERHWRPLWFVVVGVFGVLSIALSILIVRTWLAGTTFVQVVGGLFYVAILATSLKCHLIPRAISSDRPRWTLKWLGQLVSWTGLAVFLTISVFTMLRTNPLILSTFPYVIGLLEILSAIATGAGIVYIHVRGEPDRLVKAWEKSDTLVDHYSELLELCEQLIKTSALGGGPRKTPGTGRGSGKVAAAVVLGLLTSMTTGALNTPLAFGSEREAKQLRSYIDQSGSTCFGCMRRVLKEYGGSLATLRHYREVSLFEFAGQGSALNPPIAAVLLPGLSPYLAKVKLDPPEELPAETRILKLGQERAKTAAQEHAAKMRKLEEVAREKWQAALKRKSHEWAQIVDALRPKAAKETCLSEIIFLGLTAKDNTTTLIVTDGREVCPRAGPWPERLRTRSEAGRVVIVLVPRKRTQGGAVDDPMKLYAQAEILERRYPGVRVVPMQDVLRDATASAGVPTTFGRGAR